MQPIDASRQPSLSDAARSQRCGRRRPRSLRCRRNRSLPRRRPNAAGPWTPGEPTPAEPAAARPARPTIETALGTRWAVWVGGLALALGGIFLVRYSIEAGIFGPEVRLILAAILGVALVAAGEFIRRTGFQMPVEGVANAYVPGILTAAGAFTLFGTVYAAHGVYGFIGPTAAFTLLGADRHRHHRRIAGPRPGAGRRRRRRLLRDARCWSRRRRRTTGRCSASSRSCSPLRLSSRGCATGHC